MRFSFSKSSRPLNHSKNTLKLFGFPDRAWS